MSVFYIVFAIILAASIASLIFALVGKIEHKGRKINLNWMLLMISIILASILGMVLIYHAQNDLTQEDISKASTEAYNQGVEDGKFSATHTMPSNEEVEQWLSSTQKVTISTNDGGDKAVHIIDKDGDEWILIAD